MKYEVKYNESVAVITLHDRSFSVFCDALQELSKFCVGRKIWMMQSVEKENNPFRIFIVFEF